MERQTLEAVLKSQRGRREHILRQRPVQRAGWSFAVVAIVFLVLLAGFASLAFPLIAGGAQASSPSLPSPARPLSSPSPSPASSPTSGPGYRVCAYALNVRAGPGTDQPVIAWLTWGTVVRPTGRSIGVWIEIEEPTGWVNVHYLC